jgi:hypothetical protein
MATFLPRFDNSGYDNKPVGSAAQTAEGGGSSSAIDTEAEKKYQTLLGYARKKETVKIERFVASVMNAYQVVSAPSTLKSQDLENLRKLFNNNVGAYVKALRAYAKDSRYFQVVKFCEETNSVQARGFLKELRTNKQFEIARETDLKNLVRTLLFALTRSMVPGKTKFPHTTPLNAPDIIPLNDSFSDLDASYNKLMGSADLPGYKFFIDEYREYQNYQVQKISRKNDGFFSRLFGTKGKNSDARSEVVGNALRANSSSSTPSAKAANQALLQAFKNDPDSYKREFFAEALKNDSSASLGKFFGELLSDSKLVGPRRQKILRIIVEILNQKSGWIFRKPLVNDSCVSNVIGEILAAGIQSSDTSFIIAQLGSRVGVSSESISSFIAVINQLSGVVENLRTWKKDLEGNSEGLLLQIDLLNDQLKNIDARMQNIDMDINKYGFRAQQSVVLLKDKIDSLKTEVAGMVSVSPRPQSPQQSMASVSDKAAESTEAFLKTLKQDILSQLEKTYQDELDHMCSEVVANIASLPKPSTRPASPNMLDPSNLMTAVNRIQENKKKLLTNLPSVDEVISRLDARLSDNLNALNNVDQSNLLNEVLGGMSQVLERLRSSKQSIDFDSKYDEFNRKYLEIGEQVSAVQPSKAQVPSPMAIRLGQPGQARAAAAITRQRAALLASAASERDNPTESVQAGVPRA